MNQPPRPRLHCTFRKILTGSDLSRRRLPEMRLEAAAPGPTLWLTGCAHGDEVGGIVVIQEVFRRLRRTSTGRPAPLKTPVPPLARGCVRAFPLMNPLGFEVASRKISLSDEDLNRAFPGSESGSLAERIADLIFRSIIDSKPVAALDLHNDWIRSIPYAVLDARGAGMTAEAVRMQTRIAIATGLPIVQERTHMPRTLSAALMSAGVPALTLELSESYVVNEENVAVGIEAVAAVLHELGMVDAPPGAGAGKREIMPYAEIRASSSGIVRFKVAPGERVAAGQEVATVHNAFGRLIERIKSDQDALVLGLSDSSVAFPGVAMVALGTGLES